MNRKLFPTTAFAVTLSLCALAAPSASNHTVHVINSNPGGPGSFAQAILDANDDPTITRIQFTGKVRTVTLSSTVVYTGPQPLTIEGNNAIIDGTTRKCRRNRGQWRRGLDGAASDSAQRAG